MFKFLSDLDKDLQKVLLIQLRNLWTHTSTAIEGNTLTLGETAFVLEEGLTISGKPLKDHQEVVGQIRAGDELAPKLESLQTFVDFCKAAWQTSLELVDEVRKRQQARMK